MFALACALPLAKTKTTGLTINVSFTKKQASKHDNDSIWLRLENGLVLEVQHLNQHCKKSLARAKD